MKYFLIFVFVFLKILHKAQILFLFNDVRLESIFI